MVNLSRFFALAVILAMGFLAQYYGSNAGFAVVVGLCIGGLLARLPLGFARGWQAVLQTRDGRGPATNIATALGASLLMWPLLINEAIFPFLRPLSLPLVLGAILFGISMRLAGTCTSGSLQRCGSGQFQALLVIVGLIPGSVLASYHYEQWTTFQALAPLSVLRELGMFGGLLAQLGIAACLLWLLRLWVGDWRFLQLGRTHWLGIAALAVALVLAALVLNHPWGVVGLFPLLGVKLGGEWLELDADFWGYWMQPGTEAALQAPLSASVLLWLNGSVVIGAMAANFWRGHWRITWPASGWSILGGLAGGVGMGYAGVIAYGCNIGSFLGGVMSGSLHGWIWLVCAFVGFALANSLFALGRYFGR